MPTKRGESQRLQAEIHGTEIDGLGLPFYALVMDAATPPPIQPDQMPQNTVKWPKILGIIALVLGILALLQGAFAPFSIIFVEAQMEAFIEQGVDEEKVANYLEQLKSITLLSGISMAIVAMLLLVGGIMLLKRNRKAPLMLQIWAVLKILVGGYFTFRNASISRIQMEITLSSMEGTEEGAMVQQVTDYVMQAGMIVGILWLAALPVFFLIWFARQPVKEEVAKW